jgi:hypothetical protein
MREVEEALAAKGAEVARLHADQKETADFLLTCMVNVRQEIAAVKARALLAGSGGSRSLPGRQQPDSPTPADQATDRDGSMGSPPPAAAGAEAGSEPGASPQQPLLTQLSLRQRQAVLARLLDRVQPGWKETEGLMLPPSGSPSTASFALLAEASAGLTARSGGLAAQLSSLALGAPSAGTHR